MSIYPSPKMRNGVLNTVFNNTDYIQTNLGGSTIAQTDGRYLKNSGVVVSSANTTFNGTLNVGALATFGNITATGLFKSVQTAGNLIAETFRADQVYNSTNGMVYSILSDTTVVNTVSFTDIPTTINQSYIYTFIIRPSAVNSPYYIKPVSNTINVNGVSIPLYGLQNVNLPASYTYLIQQITIIYNLYGTVPQYIALTSVSAF